MGPGTLYTSIKRLLADRMFEESGERPDPDLDDQRRKYYRLTKLGRKVLAAEVQRMERMLRHARTKRVAKHA
jgi:DNA-binding PadR family transcriptional regulator